MRGSRACVLFVLVVATLACGRRPGSIDISPKKARIYGVDSTQRLTGHVLDKKGQTLEQLSVTWSSAKESVATEFPGGPRERLDGARTPRPAATGGGTVRAARGFPRATCPEAALWFPRRTPRART